MKKRYRTRYDNGHPGHVYETLPEAIAAVRIHIGPLTLGHIEPCESEAN